MTWFAFQAGLTYVCGSQSDPDVMNLFYQQSGGLDEKCFSCGSRRISSRRWRVTTTTSLEVFEEGVQFGGSVINDEGINFRAADSGEGGNFIAFYVEDVDTTADTDFRLFAESTGIGAGREDIGSAGIGRREVESGGKIRVSLLPRGETIGRFDPATGLDDENRPHATSQVHVVFRETEADLSPGAGFHIRTRRFLAGESTAPFGDRFVPKAGADFVIPFEIDLPHLFPDSSRDAEVIGLAVESLRVGLWFQEGDHLYFQIFDDDSIGSEGFGWHGEINGADPFLIDDDSEIGVKNFIALRRRSETCEALEGAAIFWTKEFDDDSGDERLQVRIFQGP